MIQRYMAAIGKRGGKARAERLSPERRSEIARNAGKAPKKPKLSVDSTTSTD